jgi:hypothetical protein
VAGGKERGKMNKLLTVAIAVGLLLISMAVNAQSEGSGTQVPPVAQTLVREGDFAVKLVDTLKIGRAENETEAESILASAGIAPRNGWIADYPVTPDIIGELQNAIGEAADSGRLAMERNEAVRLFQDVTAQAGIPVVADTQDEYPGDVDARNYAGPPDPSVINNYYHNEGPPVITYYPPPWDYDYMYAWVPSPFWCSGFFFPGFYALHDFHKVIIVNKRVIVVTNHFRDHRNRRVFRIDPERRHFREDHGVVRGISPRGGFDSAEARNGASSIFDRSRERTRPGNLGRTRVERGPTDRNPISPRSGGSAEKQTSNNNERKLSISNSRTGNQARPPTIDHRISRVPAEIPSRDMTGRTFNRPDSTDRRNEMKDHRPPASEVRPFSPPTSGRERSFTPPMQSQGRSFSLPPVMGKGLTEAPQGRTGRNSGFGHGIF